MDGFQRRMAGGLLGGLALLSCFAAQGCSTTCADCGPCGFVGGPNQGNALSAIAIVDQQQLLVQIQVGATGECGQEHAFWFDGAKVSAPPKGAMPDFGAAKSSGTDTYSYGSNSVEIVRVTATSTRVTFMGSVPKACSTSDGKTATCS